jgi:hypothetical protein
MIAPFSHKHKREASEQSGGAGRGPLCWRWLWTGLAVAVLALVAGLAVTGAQQARVHLEVPQQQINAKGAPFPVTVLIDGVENLGAFEFLFAFDAKLLKFVEAKEGAFLGSSGREVQCLSPRASEGLVKFTCLTLGPTPDGPSGSGVLATVTLEPLAEGTSGLELRGITITNPAATKLPITSQDSLVAVGQPLESSAGINWKLWGPVVAVASLLALAAAAGFAWWVRRPRGA